MIELGRRNERKTETGFVELDEPKVLNEIVAILKREFQYDNQEIADNLRLSLDDYMKLFDPTKGNRFKIRNIRQSI
jgi:hypothetical protein